ncbi:vicilin-like antimicrobial peptides 2-2 [Cynara cardunculus var. scolymus]|uniref:vicilin-like antimicrobial peptides 2-2 n=1 Tax=Cynara cardunculus var. scolymus TaxID=59895 RepID=UPI000D62CAE4|nr:vicilin-like antimicrobial peptides 2-2 [Cynara cardunculus var. scolymus]
MVVRAKSCLLFLFSVVVILSATVTLALSDKNADIVVCQLKCEKLPGDQQLSCKQTCEEFHEAKVRNQQDQENRGRRLRLKNWSGDFDEGQRSNNPYVFEDRHFTTRLESQLGNVRVLQKFTDRSELFRGIEEYRVGFLEAEPQTFIIPNHWDADALLFVVNGEGTISLINPKSRQTFNIKRGDIFRVPAGISAYLINRHNNQKLVLAKILRSISVPGELQTFFSVGGENPESSFLNAFSTEVLEAAFDTNRDEIERLFFGQQVQKGVFKKATAEQIKSLEESRIWPFGEGKGSYNIFSKSASVQNENGQLHEVDSDDLSELRDIDVAVSFFNISQGSMAGPFYNTRATMVLVVPNGEGEFEMACPHLSEQHSRGGFGGRPSYEKVSSQLRRGTVVVVPAGHPVVIEATGNQNLEVIGFGLNSDRNEWFPIAGKDNVMSQWEDEAVELTFGAPGSTVKKVIQKQKRRMFFKGPARRGRAFA